MIDFVELNVLALYFVYGLSFYTLGIAIAVQYRSYSSFMLANSMNLLAVFAVLLGLGEWGNLFMPVRVPNFGDFPVWKLMVFQRLVVSMAYFFLLCFGVKAINSSLRRPYRHWYMFPTLAFLIWLVMFSRFALMPNSEQVYQWLLHSDCWSRYLLAFPGGILTAVGLFLQIPEAKKIGDSSEPLNLWVAIVSFVMFSLFNGLVVPNEMGFLGEFLNSTSFKHYTGLPVEFFRALVAVLATWSITSMLSIFETEKHRQILNSRRSEAICRERERFARDLHDDVIQSIYGSGLDLQAAAAVIGKNQDLAVTRVTAVINRLNLIIRHLRIYIQDLEEFETKQDFREAVDQVISECRGDAGLQIRYSLQLDDNVRDKLWRMDNERKQVILILREALSNVIKHAQATQAELDIRAVDGTLLLLVKDNGQGLPDNHSDSEGEPGLGLRNIKTRAMILGGLVKWSSKQGQGTTMELSIPLP